MVELQGDRCAGARPLPSGAGGLDVRDWEPKTFSMIKAVTPARHDSIFRLSLAL